MSNNDGRLAAIERSLMLSRGKPLEVSEAAKWLGLPGSWTLRRLEARGLLPAARRSLARGDRYYRAEDVSESESGERRRMLATSMVPSARPTTRPTIADRVITRLFGDARQATAPDAS